MIFISLLLCIFIIITQEDKANILNEEIAYPGDSIDKQLTTEVPKEHVDIFRVCEEGLGCIETDQTWYHKDYRPVNLRPLARTIIKSDFLFVTKSTAMKEKLVYTSFHPKEESIKKAGFNNESELMILIHDFTGNGYTGWTKHLCNKIFLNSMDYNLISIDWQRGAEPPYDQAIANGRIVALEIISFIKELKEKLQYSLDYIHIVGHGVGAHIAGYVGATYNKIKKITGLDPSGPRFQGMPYNVKLNPRSARYVEVIHTDFYQTRSQGSNETLGHSDFFVNGAKKQPGCPDETKSTDFLSIQRGNLKKGEILPGCSHKRAFKYFIESIGNKKCVFQGIKCNNLDDFENGKCTVCNIPNRDCKLFGLKTYLEMSENNMFFLNTAASSPYCMLEYKITVFIKNTEKYGFFDIIMIDENADISEAHLSAENRNNFRIFKKDSRETGNTFIYFAKPPRLHNIRELKVKWNEKKKLYCVIYCIQTIIIEKISITFLGTGEDDASEEAAFCPSSKYLEIEGGTYVTFKRCNEKTQQPQNKEKTSTLQTAVTERFKTILTQSTTEIKKKTTSSKKSKYPKKLDGNLNSAVDYTTKNMNIVQHFTTTGTETSTILYQPSSQIVNNDSTPKMNRNTSGVTTKMSTLYIEPSESILLPDLRRQMKKHDENFINSRYKEKKIRHLH